MVYSSVCNPVKSVPNKNTTTRFHALKDMVDRTQRILASWDLVLIGLLDACGEVSAFGFGWSADDLRSGCRGSGSGRGLTWEAS